ncbi:MAG: hypothetical protein EOP85_03290 [Verrucomicrobiaceae bacterium]|nr:MAG: hypothetical protein EOP85_03290 [Verrucomicrobiaceae bacterium]
MENDPVKDPLHIRVKHDLPEEPVFVGHEVGLVFQGQTAAVVSHEIFRPGRTWLKKGEGEFEEVCGSLRGIIRGHGPVPPNNSEAFITLGNEEKIYVPHGHYEELAGNIEGTATWSFSFAYTVKPCGCSG